MSNYLFHKLSEEEREKIKKQAKEIMENFAHAIKDFPEMEVNLLQREEQIRQEENTECDDVFKKIFFKNAPSSEKNFIVAEKKRW